MVKIIEDRNSNGLIVTCNNEMILKRIKGYVGYEGCDMIDGLTFKVMISASLNIFKAVKNSKESVEITPIASIRVQEFQKKHLYNVEKIQKIKSQYNQKIVEAYKRGERSDDGIFFDYKYVGKYPNVLSHQKIMYNLLAYTDQCALLSDPGTCKTGPYLWAIDTRIQRRQVKRALVITLNPLKLNVMAEMNDQVPHLSKIIIDSSAHANKVFNKLFTKMSKGENKDYDVYIISYDLLRTSAKYIPDNFFDMVVVDEGHRIAYHDSIQSMSILKSFKFVPYKYLITGTLASNSLVSFHTPYKFMGLNTIPIADFEYFRNVYMSPADSNQRIWTARPGANAVIRDIIAKFSVTYKKDDCLDLPEIVFSAISTQMSSDQQKCYNEMKSDLKAYIGDMCDKCDKRVGCSRHVCNNTIAVTHLLTVATRLRQITSGFVVNKIPVLPDFGEDAEISLNDEVEMMDTKLADEEEFENILIQFNENPKLNLLIDVLQTIPSGEKVIIWCCYIHSVKTIYDTLASMHGKSKVISCYGSDNAYQKVQEFKSDGVEYIVASYSKLGVGQNMQFSSYMIFFENSFSYVFREQQLGRQHRQGQKKKVTVIDLQCAKTIDVTLLQCLKSKTSLAEYLVSGSRVALLNDD